MQSIYVHTIGDNILNFIFNIKMLENKDTNNPSNVRIDKEVDEVSEFVEFDPTGRYGRVINFLTIIFSSFVITMYDLILVFFFFF